MRSLMWMCAIAVVWPAASPCGEIDQGTLVEAFRAYDAARNEGKGYSEAADSGTLGWGEGQILQDYVRIWDVTDDVYWLEKLRDHFRRIMGTASDPDGDGYLSWNTATYSSAVAYAERLHNVSNAHIEPAFQRNRNAKAAAECTGHSYLIEFPQGPKEYRVVDWDTRQVVAGDIPYVDGGSIKEVAPFQFVIRGEPHQGDRFLIRTIAPEPIEYAVHQGMFVYAAARFVEAVKTRPDLRERFAADAEEFLAFINKHVFEKNERDWLGMGEMGGGYRFEPKITDRYPNRIMPHNQFATLARAWLVLAEVDGAAPLMATRAEQMVRYVRRHMEVDEKRGAYRWHYWDWIEYGEPGHSGYEDTSHAAITVSLAIEAARRGVVFTDADMEGIAKTWVDVMWNKDEAAPRMAASVDGREPYEFSACLRNWSELAQWDRRVYELARTAFLASDEKQRTSDAPVMLLCAKVARGVEKE